MNSKIYSNNFPDNLPLPIKGKWVVKGDAELLSKPKAAILLSRQTRSPSPDSWWIHATYSAAKWAAEQGYTILSGKGLTHLDFTRWSANIHGNCALVDINSNGEEISDDSWSKLQLSLTPDIKNNKQFLYKCRDELIADIADILIIISFRKGGIMEGIINRAINKKPIYIICVFIHDVSNVK